MVNYKIPTIVGLGIIGGLLSLNAIAQESVPERTEPLKPSFWEEERQPQPQGFRRTFLFDALNGIGDPLSGTGNSSSAVDQPVTVTTDQFPTQPSEPGEGIFDISVPSSSRPIPPFTGDLEANGDFTFTVPPTEQSSPFNFTFNVGTTTFVVNQAIDVKGNFIDAALMSPEGLAILDSLGVTADRNAANSEIESATVTPQEIPRNIPVFRGMNGGIIVGPIPDR